MASALGDFESKGQDTTFTKTPTKRHSDAHGKNFAILYDPDLGPRLAPLYDAVCTAVYDVTTKMAMRIGGEEEPQAVTDDAWRRLADECSLNAPLLLRDLRSLASRIIGCADAVSRTATAEGWHRPIIDQIREVIEQRAALLLPASDAA